MQPEIHTDSREFQINDLKFYSVQLFFGTDTINNLFALKNNKTVGETISERRYKPLAETIKTRFPDSLKRALGEFLLERKQAGDEIFSRFLNHYGDETYCRFYFQDSLWAARNGLYFYMVGKDIVYFGQSKDSFGKRINHGYGNISPKNCYLDGQATNCHLNSLINQHKGEVSLYLCGLNDLKAIDHLEKALIQTWQPVWNIALKNSMLLPVKGTYIKNY